MIYDIIIVGGGASGLTLANVAKARGRSVLIIEAAKRVGRKILVAGNGKCNISNESISTDNYNNPSVAKYLARSGEVAELFESLGLVTRSVGGRIYPYTESGNTVLNLLRRRVEDDCVTEERVEEIDFFDGLFTVNGRRAKNVAICTGGITSGGIPSYGLAEKFGHGIAPVYPVLAPIRTDSKYIKTLAGIRVKAKLTLFSGRREIYRESGELLFKDNGLSGIVALGLSRHIEPSGRYLVSVDLCPEYSAEELRRLNREGLLQRAVLSAVERQAADRKISFEEAAKDFVADVVSVDGSTAQVTRGGVPLTELSDVFESKYRPGLYVCGEVLDVDGECGGYNLHWAFLSGIIAGKAI